MSRGVLAARDAPLRRARASGSGSAAIPADLPGPVRDAFVEEDRALRAEIIDTIEDNFYKPVDESKLEDASLKGIVAVAQRPATRTTSRPRRRASSTRT